MPENPQPFDGREPTAKSAQSIVQSAAISATTLAADSFKKASIPSVVSATKTIALSNHEDLIFPPAPTGRLEKRFKQLKKQREEEHKAYVNSLKSNQSGSGKLVHQVLQVRYCDEKKLAGLLHTLFRYRTCKLSLRRGKFYLNTPRFLTEKELNSILKADLIGEDSDTNFFVATNSERQKELDAIRKEGDSMGGGDDMNKKYLDAQIHAAEAKLQATLEGDWKCCCEVIAEMACPFCFYALPSLDVVDEKKWKYVFISVLAALGNFYHFT